MGYDLINALYASTFVFIFFYTFKVPIVYYFLILFHLIAVFLTNGVLFPISYMPDQYRYINAAQSIRESLDFLHYYQFDRAGYGTVSNAALVFAVFPIPFLHSVYSIAVINFILYSFLFIYLYRKKILTDNAKWFYLFYPSFALYAAIGGRDTLVLVFMILSVYQLYKGNTKLSIILSVPLLFIKFQNFFIFILSVILYKAINHTKFFTTKNLIKFGILLIGVFLLGNMISIEEIDKYRWNMYMEDGGDSHSYIPLTSFLDLFATGIPGSIYMLLKPLFWESSNMLQFIQSFENAIIFIIIVKLVIALVGIKDKFKYFLFIYFSTAMAIYGIVVFNFGTAARYKYTFVIIFVIFAMYLLNKNKRKPIE